MKKFIFFIFILSLPCVGFGKDLLDKHTILKDQKAKAVASQCSRENPPAFTEIWVPEEKTISYLESNLEKIEQLSPNHCCLANVHISNVRSYFRQYIGIVSKGRKLIYINAFLGPKAPNN